jgi:hypothetical protein
MTTAMGVKAKFGQSALKGELSADGVYTLRVHLIGAAKSEGKELGYTLKVNIAPGQTGSAASGKPSH